MTSAQSVLPVGVIAALPAEARALGVSGPCNRIIESDSDRLLYVCGVGPDNARRATRELLAAGVGGLVSWGAAGGLTAAMQPGTLLLAHSVVCADAAYETDRSWVARLTECIDPTMPAHRQAIYSGGLLVSGAAEKQQLARETGAVAVDMESGVIAETAVAAHVPFVCIRAIVDPWTFSVPASVGAALDGEGFVSLSRALRGLACRPAEIVPMLRMALHFRSATQALQRLSRAAGPRLLAP